MNKKSSGDYGFLVDQLDIRRNELESDGKLGPGDYDVLISEADKLYSHPGLTSAQRSKVLVKRSGFVSEKKVKTLNEKGDIDKLNREFEDDVRTNNMMFSSNPSVLLQANGYAMKMKIDNLATTIDSMDQAGADTSRHLAEYNASLSSYSDLLQAEDDVKKYKKDGKPFSNYVAYVTTNSDGEVVDVNIGKTGSKTGYVETNGLYGGLQIYGKVNRKEFGKNIFKLGNNTFSAADFSIPDPQNPGATRYNPLISSDQQKQFGAMTAGTIGVYKDIDLAGIRPQGTVRTGTWAEGEKGFLYQRQSNGNYKKWENASKESLGIKDNDIIKVPRIIEAGIIPYVEETIPSGSNIDNKQNFINQSGPLYTPIPSSQFPSKNTATSSPVSINRNPAPTERAPMASEPQSVASSTLESAKGFFRSFFGR